MLLWAKHFAMIGFLAAPVLSYAQAGGGCTAASRFLTETRLQCVSCALENATGVKPSEKFIALMGVTAERYTYLAPDQKMSNGDVIHAHSADGGEALRNFQRKVIQQIQAYGFCKSGSSYGDKVPVTMFDLVYPAVSGSKSKDEVQVRDGKKVLNNESSTGLSAKEMKKVAEYLGFSSTDDMSNLFESDYFKYSSPLKRQEVFKKAVKSNRNSYHDDLKSCLDEMTGSEDTDAKFRLRPEVVNRDNQKLCEAMAKECELPSTDFCYKTPAPPALGNDSGSSGGSGASGAPVPAESHGAAH